MCNPNNGRAMIYRQFHIQHNLRDSWFRHLLLAEIVRSAAIFSSLCLEEVEANSAIRVSAYAESGDRSSAWIVAGQEVVYVGSKRRRFAEYNGGFVSPALEDLDQ